MSGQSVRNFSRVAIAIVIAAVVISAAALSYTSFEATVTKTISSSTYTTVTGGTSRLYQVEFLQESNCRVGPGWLFPWGLILDSQTLTQPSNATLPLIYNESHLTSESNYSTIWFSLPNGTYGYKIIPDDPLGSAQSGNVTVDGSNTVVQVYAFITAMGCSSTTS
jgi:hypothetical protein